MVRRMFAGNSPPSVPLFANLGHEYTAAGGPRPRPRAGAMNCKLDQFNANKVRLPSQKVLVYEEDENTIDDGHASPDDDAVIDLLAIRHDRKRKLPESETDWKTNTDRRGNVLFCDGHAEYITRKLLHTPLYYQPDQTQ